MFHIQQQNNTRIPQQIPGARFDPITPFGIPGRQGRLGRGQGQPFRYIIN